MRISQCCLEGATLLKRDQIQGVTAYSPPRKGVCGLFVLGFACANTPSALKQRSQAHLTARVSAFTQGQSGGSLFSQ